MARREKMTLRDLYNVTAAARGHWVIYGTPARIAGIFEEWFTSGRADGFIIMPAYFPPRSTISSTWSCPPRPLPQGLSRRDLALSSRRAGA